jgi:hypothetical protein
MRRVREYLGLTAVLTAACTSELNPRQERAWEDFQTCRSVAPTARIVELQENGLLRYEAIDANVRRMESCLKERGRWSRNLEPQRPEPPFPTKDDETAFQWLKDYKLKARAPAAPAQAAETTPSPAMDMVSGEVETRYVPPRVLLIWPLRPGKTWENTSTRESPGDRQTSVIVEACQIGALESVTVPAGTFEAYKITCRNLRTGRINHEIWYSPEVKHYIRERSRFDYGIRERELILFKPASRSPS